MAKKYDILFRVLLVGDSNVGKTCMMCRYIDDEFHNSHIATIGIDFKLKTVHIEGKRVRIQVWDTAGQERYQTITRQYYRRAQGILLVYDITNRESFNNMKKWMHQVNEYAPQHAERMLVGNKCDIDEKREVTREEGEKFAQDCNYRFFETSAFTDQNINLVFTEMTKVLQSKHQNEVLLYPVYSREISDENFQDLQELEKESGCCLLM